MNTIDLPIMSLKDDVLSARRRGAVVLTAPTGSGKSTQLPRWMLALGPTLVVEPRRIACRALAEWVSNQESCELGQRVGYAIRDEERQSAATQLLFVTPGVALRLIAQDENLDRFLTIIIDEFHERGWQTDLLLALLKKRRPDGLVVMSATMNAKPLAAFLGATIIESRGRGFPVSIEYAGHGTILPTMERLEERINQVLTALVVAGDVLVFLPGKAEIARVRGALNSTISEEFEVCELHSGLSIESQRAIFSKGSKPKLFLSTNIAETSITLPRVKVVIDSGLVRRTQYFAGRAFLGLAVIAQDAADQRAGRAGRVSEGRAIRLWSKSALLETETPPELTREGLSSFVLANLMCGENPRSLSYLTVPKTYAVDSAMDDLKCLGAIDEGEQLNSVGWQLARVPLEPHFGRLMIQALNDGCAEMMAIVIAMISLTPAIHLAFDGHPADELQWPGCDVWLALTAFFQRSSTVCLSRVDRARVRERAHRLANLFGVTPAESIEKVSRVQLAQCIATADPRFVFFKRTRNRNIYWANGHSEGLIGSRTALNKCLDRGLEMPEGLVALEVFGVSHGHGKRRLQLSWLMPIGLGTVQDELLGEEVLKNVRIGENGLEGFYERTHANQVLGTLWRAVAPTQLLEVVEAALQQGWLWPELVTQLRYTLTLWERVAYLERRPVPEEFTCLSAYVSHWFKRLGVEESRDFLCFDPIELLPEPMDPLTVSSALKKLPDEVMIGSIHANVTYDLKKKLAILSVNKRLVKQRIDVRFLPNVEGFSISVRDGSRLRLLRK